MKILTLRLPMELYNKLWQIHSDSRNNINSIIIELIEKGLEKPTEEHEDTFEELMVRNPDDDYEGIPELSEETQIALKNYMESRKRFKKVKPIEKGLEK